MSLVGNNLPNSTNLSEFAVNLLKKCVDIKKPENPVRIEDFIKKSDEFPLEFGTDNCRVKSQSLERYNIIEKQISSAYPVIHERVLHLYLAFLEHKIKYGTAIERAIFENLTIVEFVQRLLAKRCACFVGPMDHYVLLTGEEGCGRFEEIGSGKESHPLVMKNLLSYHEMKLSALLSVTSHSDFINNGKRQNNGYIETDKSKFTQAGVVIGIVGPRFHRYNVMDCEDIIVSRTQNTTSNGYAHHWFSYFDGKTQDYRRIWNEFYNEKSFLYKDIRNYKDAENERFHKYRRNYTDTEELYFDAVVLKKRYIVSFDTLLLEAESRAGNANMQGYLHVVGFGLGVWRATSNQESIFLETFLERLKYFLISNQLNHIDVVDFSYFYQTSFNDELSANDNFLASASHPNGGIKILLSKRTFAEKLPKEYENALLIVSFAWDSNALPGNEFWMKCLGNSSDSTTASNTLITELMNPHINTVYVNGNNLHIATEQNGIVHIRDYCSKILNLF